MLCLLDLLWNLSYSQKAIPLLIPHENFDDGLRISLNPSGSALNENEEDDNHQ